MKHENAWNEKRRPGVGPGRRVFTVSVARDQTTSED